VRDLMIIPTDQLLHRPKLPTQVGVEIANFGYGIDFFPQIWKVATVASTW